MLLNGSGVTTKACADRCLCNLSFILVRIVTVDASNVSAALNKAFAITERRNLIRYEQVIGDGIRPVGEAGMTLGAYGDAVCTI